MLAKTEPVMVHDAAVYPRLATWEHVPVWLAGDAAVTLRHTAVIVDAAAPDPTGALCHWHPEFLSSTFLSTLSSNCAIMS